MAPDIVPVSAEALTRASRPSISPTPLIKPPVSTHNTNRRLHQAELEADSWIADEGDDGRTQLMSAAARNELVAEPLLIFSDFQHAHTWVQLWGAQHRPMKLLPGGSTSRRVYVCRHPLYGKYSERTRKKSSERAPWKTQCATRKPASAGSNSCAATEESLAATEVCARKVLRYEFSECKVLRYEFSE